MNHLQNITLLPNIYTVVAVHGEFKFSLLVYILLHFQDLYEINAFDRLDMEHVSNKLEINICVYLYLEEFCLRVFRQRHFKIFAENKIGNVRHEYFEIDLYRSCY